MVGYNPAQQQYDPLVNIGNSGCILTGWCSDARIICSQTGKEGSVEQCQVSSRL
jgi:hypothetical protein